MYAIGDVADIRDVVIQLKWLRDKYESQQVLLEALRETAARRGDRAREARRAISAIPTSSDVYCLGGRLENRTCRIRNLCMSTREERFFILRGDHSMLYNPPTDLSSRQAFLELTTLESHNVFYWRYEEVHQDYFLRRADTLHVQLVEHDRNGKMEHRTISRGIHSKLPKTNLTIVKGRTFLTKRFYPVNIMHVFHDDWLGLYSLRDIWPSLLDPFDDHYDPPPRDPTIPPQHRLTVFEHHARQSYDAAYEWLGQFERIEDHLGWPEWPKDDAPESYICYQDAVVGNSKALSWYQYGYGKPQGPKPGHTATGWKLREGALFALRKMGLPPWDRQIQVETIRLILANQTNPLPTHITKSGACIAIISRLSTRLILNEVALAAHLEGEFGLPVCWIRLEELSMAQIITRLRGAVMAFGMHGSLLILTMFLPPGAILIEGYPYGVPPENYTPYRTMCALPGMLLTYRSWVPTNSTASIGHPDRRPRQGGLGNLNATYRNFILTSTTIPPHECCDNPHWLYRIFQDTTVDALEVARLMREALQESYTNLPEEWKR